MPIRATWVVGRRPKPNFNYYRIFALARGTQNMILSTI